MRTKRRRFLRHVHDHINDIVKTTVRYGNRITVHVDHTDKENPLPQTVSYTHLRFTLDVHTSLIQQGVHKNPLASPAKARQ